MGVYVKDMKMPPGCPYCPMSHWTIVADEFAGCNVVPGKRFAAFNDEAYAQQPARSRPDWCPLVEVPEPHGRLIDAEDASIKFICTGQDSKRYKLGERWELNCEEINKVIASLRTIIPAEEGSRWQKQSNTKCITTMK